MGFLSSIKEAIAFRRAMKQLARDFEEKLAHYQALTTEELQALPDEELCMAAVSRVEKFVESFGDEPEDIKASLAALSEPQRVVYVLDYLEREVNNGGLCQYFVNSSRYTAPYISEAFAAVGSIFHQALYDSFIADNGIDVQDLSSFDCYKIEEFQAQYERYPFDDFDTEFYELGELEAWLLPYIKAHIEAF